MDGRPAGALPQTGTLCSQEDERYHVRFSPMFSPPSLFFLSLSLSFYLSLFLTYLYLYTSASSPPPVLHVDSQIMALREGGGDGHDSSWLGVKGERERGREKELSSELA